MTHRLQLLVLLLLLAVAPLRAQTLFFSSGGGPKALTISTAVPGYDPEDVVDDLSELTWDALGVESTAKITVDSSCPGQSFSLYLNLSVTSGVGTEQSEVALTDGMFETDILRDIPIANPSGTGTLSYRAHATAAQGTSAQNGSDIHSITFTILEQ